jgi:uncharacterized protein YceK
MKKLLVVLVIGFFLSGCVAPNSDTNPTQDTKPQVETEQEIETAQEGVGNTQVATQNTNTAQETNANQTTNDLRWITYLVIGIMCMQGLGVIVTVGAIWFLRYSAEKQRFEGLKKKWKSLSESTPK